MVLIALGALTTGFFLDSPWALLIALPFAVAGVLTVDDPGPLENTDEGWGVLILVVFALPVTVAAGLGALIRRRSRQ